MDCVLIQLYTESHINTSLLKTHLQNFFIFTDHKNKKVLRKSKFFCNFETSQNIIFAVLDFCTKRSRLLATLDVIVPILTLCI